MTELRDNGRDERLTDLRDWFRADIARLEANIRELRQEILDLRLEKVNRFQAAGPNKL